MSSKAKISITVASGLLEEVDELAGIGGRSAIIEAALASWLRAQRKQRLESDIERYYRGLTAEEALEDRDWAETGDAMVAESWDD
jgi:metal-responsive CopG/Arc/MetJ family transcriptional regulator